MSRRAEKRAARARTQYAGDLRWLLAQPQGRRVLGNLIKRSGVDQVTAFTGNSQTFYNLGCHDFVRTLVADLRAVDLANYRRLEDEVLYAVPDPEPADEESDDPE